MGIYKVHLEYESPSMHLQLVSILIGLSCGQSRGGCWVPIIPCGILPEELLSINMNLTRERERQMGMD